MNENFDQNVIAFLRAVIRGLCVLILFLLFLMFSMLFFPRAHAADNSYSYRELEKRQSTLRPAKQRIRPEPITPVQRYNEEDLRNDPQVLVALPKNTNNTFLYPVFQNKIKSEKEIEYIKVEPIERSVNLFNEKYEEDE